MKIIQILIDKDEAGTLLGLGSNGIVYIWDRDAGTWKKYTDNDFEK